MTNSLRTLDRRRFLTLTGGVVAVLTVAQLSEALAAQATELDMAPFTLGVASGDPTMKVSCCGPAWCRTH